MNACVLLGPRRSALARQRLAPGAEHVVACGVEHGREAGREACGPSRVVLLGDLARLPGAAVEAQDL